MSLRYLTRYATTTLALVVCAFAASSVHAVGLNDAQLQAAGSIAYSDPVSAQCHPALGACAKRSPRVAEGAKGNPTAPGYDFAAAIYRDPVSSVCHPALKACASWARRVQTSELAK